MSQYEILCLRLTQPFTDECVLWHGSLDTDGYGQLRNRGAMTKAHKVAQPCPPGKVVRHSCRNRSCYNPNHLTTGTPQDNVDDRTRDGTYKNGRTVLNWDKVQEIRKLYTGKHGEVTKLATQFHIGRTQILRIVRGEQWQES